MSVSSLMAFWTGATGSMNETDGPVEAISAVV